MVEAQGTPFSRGLIEEDESAKEIENEQPGFHRSKTRRKGHVIPSQESVHHCHRVQLKAQEKQTEIYPVSMIVRKSLCP